MRPPLVCSIPPLHPPRRPLLLSSRPLLFSPQQLSESTQPSAQSPSVDRTAAAVVHIHTLKELSLLNGGWVEIVADGSEQWRPCRVVAGEDIGQEEVLLSPVFSFNLGLGPFNQRILMRRFARGPPPCTLLAHEASVARVKTSASEVVEKTVSARTYALALSAFFSLPRLVALGDIIGVPYPCGDADDWDGDEATENDFNEALNTGPSAIVWFKVTSITPATAAAVCRAATTLMQSGAVNSMIPQMPSSHAFLAAAAGLVPPVPVPPLDSDVLNSLMDVLAPMVSEVSRSLLVSGDGMPSVLVHGMKGAGKLSCLEAAAAKLGMHTLIVSARQLAEPSDGGTTGTAMRAALQKAVDLSPCVLIISGMGSASSGGRSGPNAEEAEQRLGAALNNAASEFSSVTSTDSSGPQNEGAQSGGNKDNPAHGVVVLAGTADSLEDVPACQRRAFTHTVEVPLPGELLRLDLLKYYMRGCALAPSVSETVISRLAKRLVGRCGGDIKALVANAAIAALKRKAPTELSLLEEAERDAVDAGSEDTQSESASLLLLDVADLEAGEANLLPTNSSMSIGCPRIPSVKWDDVGGLAVVKDEIMEVIELPLKHPEVFVPGVKRRTGVLLYGPPGTGKTLVAKAIATECGLPFFSVKGPELLDMYVGESERNVRQVFAQARSAAPCVLFFDELDSLAPQRGRGADSGGVMDRVVAQLLSELDGVADNGGGGGGTVFVVGATNRPDLLDPSLLRPGRFDRLLYLGTGGEPGAQLKILKAATRKFCFEDGVDLAEIARDIPNTFTGADISAVASTAQQVALKRRVMEIEETVLLAAQAAAMSQSTLPALTVAQVVARMSESELTVKVSTADFRVAIASVTPSVSDDEMRHYERLRQQFGG